MALAGHCVAPDKVERIEFLKLLLDAVGDLLDHVPRRRARPIGLDHHGLDGEGRVFLAAKLAIGQDARGQGQSHEIPHEGFALERPFGEVETVHRFVSASEFSKTRTAWPGTSECTPAVTTRSPLASPALIVTVPEPRSLTVTARS